MIHQSLLLLPRLPLELSFNSLRDAYGISLQRVLTEMSQISSNTNDLPNDVSLNVVVVDYISSYAEIEKFYRLMYRLACVIMTECSIDVRFGNDINVQITLVSNSDGDQQLENSLKIRSHFISLADLARRHEVWDRVYSVDSESGEKIFQDYLRLYDSSLPESSQQVPITKVPAGLATQSKRSVVINQDSGTHRACHRSVAVGGTFDHLHAGHKLLLTMTAMIIEPIDRSDSSGGRYMTIGITGDDLLQKKKYAEALETWEERQRSIRKFLLKFLPFLAAKNILEASETVTNSQDRGREVRDTLRSGLQIRYKEIFDPFGPTVTDSRITALVVSSETRAGGKAVNEKRTDKGWQPLEVFEVDVVDAEEGGGDGSKDSFESKISSTEIRARILRRNAAENARS